MVLNSTVWDRGLWFGREGIPPVKDIPVPGSGSGSGSGSGIASSVQGSSTDNPLVQDALASYTTYVAGQVDDTIAATTVFTTLLASITRSPVACSGLM